ncbi:MAG TPA: DNA translocase FtsK 4TM domain-containing protein [Oligoflexia bacterium]|nr:DNA translocase FtsK 4TM domain-containing protein [Oligoflexia bacterium]HMR24482.1 DNA translocase FtsK 4TM domain-containing protein [Oligoflexia bacterium]
MPKKKTKNAKIKTVKSVTKDDHASHWAVREFWAFSLFTFAVFSLIAVVSYNPVDPSLTTIVEGQHSIYNFGGLVGSYLADMYIQALGYASYLLIALFFLASILLVFTENKILQKRKVFSACGLLLSTAICLSLFDKDTTYPSSWGGALGFWAAQYGQSFLGIAGTALLVGVTFFASIFFITGLSVKQFFLQCKNGIVFSVQTVLSMSQKLILTLGQLFKRGQSKLKQKPEYKDRFDQNKLMGKKITLQDVAKQASDLAVMELDEDIPIVIKKSNKEDTQENDQVPIEDDFYDDKSAVVFKATEDPIKYTLPDLNLLEAPKEDDQELVIDKEELLRNARILEAKLNDFGVKGKVIEVQPGPVVTMYEFEPAPGVKVNQIIRLNDDLTLALKALSVRINMLPGKAAVGIEVANSKRQTVYLKDIVKEDVFQKNQSLLTMTLGKDISGNAFTADLRKMPHLLVAGATGSGKSVAVNSMITSILYKATPDQVRMILVDPKMLELSLYDKIPHLLLPVVTDPRKASAALRWAVAEMERRYRLMADIGVRNLEGYNAKVWDIIEEQKRIEEEKQAYRDADESNHTVYEKKEQEHKGTLPFIVIVIDELADLMMVSSREVEESIIRLAQMARAAGIHLLLATQRPSVDVITGVIKANMPSRISFQVSSKIDSRTIIDSNGAEMLLGSGDMLYLPPGTSKLQRIHGAFVSDKEVERVTNFWKAQAKPQYKEEILQAAEESILQSENEGSDPDDELYPKALELVLRHGSGSISMIQRRLRIGYNRAARLIERMEEEGYLVPGDTGKPKELNMNRFEGMV